MILKSEYFHQFVLALLLLTGFAPQGVDAQEFMGRLLRPIRPGESSFMETSALAAENSSRDGGGDTALRRYGLMWAQSRAKSPQREWHYSVSADAMTIDGDFVLPDSGREIAGPLYDIEFGLGSRRARVNQDIYGWFLELGSASDKPFASYDETSVMLNAFYKLKGSQESAWMFLANYSNRRSFLPDIPLPGIAYIYQLGRRKLVIAGLPFMMVRWPLGTATDLRLRYFVPDQVQIEVSRKLGRGFSLLAGGGSDEESYFLSDREKTEDRLYFEESRVYGGLEWEPNGETEVLLTVGYGVDRYFYQGEDDDDSDNDRVNLDDAADIRISVSRRF